LSSELDSHADTCSFGKSAYIVQETGETISVAGCIDTLGTVKEEPIVTAAVAYDDPATYQTYILFFHQALYFERLDKHFALCCNCSGEIMINSNRDFKTAISSIDLLRVLNRMLTHIESSPEYPGLP
jgi:hypothetical protein